MFSNISHLITEKLASNENFAVAQVIYRIAPSSSKVGDKAIIMESGEMIGWIGGGCIKGIVLKEAMEAIKTKKYRRVKVSPEGGESTSDFFKHYVMSCQSKGTVEVLIEPVWPQAELIVVGKSSIARKLVQLASEADFRVSVLANEEDKESFPQAHKFISFAKDIRLDFKPSSYVIVTTQGEGDEETLKQILKAQAPFVGFVASKLKSEQIRKSLLNAGVDSERVNALISPVGLDINAKTAGEVAVSILAEIIEHFRKEQQSEVKSGCCGASAPKVEESKFSQDYYINPVCQVPVSKQNPKHVLEYNGQQVYFCCDGCKNTFEKSPAAFIKA